ncbi:Prefoldin [Neurospora crassa]|nr:Prefoldin [Neurospora crassa]
MASPLQLKLQALSDEYQKLNKELQETVLARQKLEAQKQENVSVQNEFEKLKDDEQIFKLVGPVLLKQDKMDAENTVKGRLEFISKEITRLEGVIKETQGKIEKKRTEIIQVQTSAQAGGAPQAVKA